MPDQRSNGPNRSGFLAVVVSFLLSVVLISAWARGGDDSAIRGVQSAFQSAISPLTHLGTIVTSPAEHAGEAVGDATVSGVKLSELSAENEALRAEVAELEEYRAESQRLAALLGIRDLYGLESVTARVIGSTNDSYNRTVTIDKGTSAGVAVGMPVMNSAGLAGQVVSCGPGSSVVRLVTDYQSGVGAMLQSSRATGVVSGSSDGLMHLNYIPRTTEVTVGEIVVTSGLGGVFPKGIVIGTVVSVSGAESDTNHSIVIDPITKPTSLEEVIVITGDDEEVATPTVDQIRTATSGGGEASE